MFKKIITFGLMMFFFISPLAVHASGLTDMKTNLTQFGGNMGYRNEDNLAQKIASIINIVLGFLGIIAVVYIMYAGFKWMTAGGNDEEIGKAKSTIKNAVIGIGVIFLSYAIVNFAVSRLSDATGAQGGGTSSSQSGASTGNAAPEGPLGICTYKERNWRAACNQDKTAQNITQEECMNYRGTCGKPNIWVPNP